MTSAGEAIQRHGELLLCCELLGLDGNPRHFRPLLALHGLRRSGNVTDVLLRAFNQVIHALRDLIRLDLLRRGRALFVLDNEARFGAHVL